MNDFVNKSGRIRGEVIAPAREYIRSLGPDATVTNVQIAQHFGWPLWRANGVIQNLRKQGEILPIVPQQRGVPRPYRVTALLKEGVMPSHPKGVLSKYVVTVHRSTILLLHQVAEAAGHRHIGSWLDHQARAMFTQPTVGRRAA